MDHRGRSVPASPSSATVAFWGDSVMRSSPLSMGIGRSTCRSPFLHATFCRRRNGVVMTPIQRFAILRALEEEAEALREEHKSADSKEKTNSETADGKEKADPPQKS